MEFRDFGTSLDFLPVVLGNGRIHLEIEPSVSSLDAANGTTINGSLKYALIPRGHEVGSVAWVPATFVPYVGAGGGAHWYKVSQQGDFVDYMDLSVFTDVFRSSGWSPRAHVFGGADIKGRIDAIVNGQYTGKADISSTTIRNG